MNLSTALLDQVGEGGEDPDEEFWHDVSLGGDLHAAERWTAGLKYCCVMVMIMIVVIVRVMIMVLVIFKVMVVVMIIVMVNWL